MNNKAVPYGIVCSVASAATFLVFMLIFQGDIPLEKLLFPFAISVLGGIIVGAATRANFFPKA